MADAGVVTTAPGTSTSTATSSTVSIVDPKAVAPAVSTPTPVDTKATPATPTPPADAKAPATPTPAETQYTIKAPDGVTLGQADSEKYLAFAKAQKLSNDQLNAWVAHDQSEKKSYQESLVGALDQQDKAWLGDLQGHKEYGGQKFDESVMTVKKVFDRFDKTGTFRKALESAKLAHNPDLFWFVHDIGRAMSDDRAFTVPAATYTPGKTDPMKALADIYRAAEKAPVKK